MDKQDLQTLYTYAANCRRLLFETLQQHAQVMDRPFETLAAHSSIRKLIIHMIAAEERWIEVRISGRNVARYEDHAPATLEGLFEDWERVRGNTMSFLNGIDEGRLQQKYLVSLPHWNYEEYLSAEQILFHIYNHETHHRAQISMLLQQMQIDPPNFDFIFLHG